MFVAFQIEQDFRLMFGEVTSNKFLERWPTTFKRKIIEESHGLVPTSELLDLMRNAESADEVENGILIFIVGAHHVFSEWYRFLMKCNCGIMST